MNALVERGGSGGQRRMSLFYVKGVVVVVGWLCGGKSGSLERGDIKILKEEEGQGACSL